MARRAGRSGNEASRRKRGKGAGPAARTAGGGGVARPSRGALAGSLLVFLAVGFAIYAPAMNGDFISDDLHYVSENPYVHDPSAANVLEILNPTSVVSRLVENYAPVHLFLHAAEWKLFGPEVFGYHVVNVIVHALCSVLLVMLFVRTGIPLVAALVGGALFLVHPANVEAVAWISQLKTTAALLLTLLALLQYRERPALGVVLFGLALLAKPTAAVALPVAVTLAWVEAGREDGEPALPWGWFAVWLLVFVGFAVAEFAAFSQTAGQAPPLYAELGVRLRTTVAIALRYLVMALSGYGLSTFHEPPPAASLLDPWWVGSLVVLGLLAWRWLWTFRNRRVECAYWLWAVVSFAPICGVIPLPYPMADRYLYFMLPGLIGGALLAGRDLLTWLAARLPALQPKRLGNAALVVGLALGLYLAVQSNARANVWRTAFAVMTDAERNYPEGTAAKTRQARRAALEGDVEGAVAALRAAVARGYNRLDHLLQDPAYAPLRSDPRFDALLTEIAVEWRDRLGQGDSPSQIELRALAQAEVFLGDLGAAVATLERALATPGPITADIEDDLREVKTALRIQQIKESRGSSR